MSAKNEKDIMVLKKVAKLEESLLSSKKNSNSIVDLLKHLNVSLIFYKNSYEFTCLIKYFELHKTVKKKQHPLKDIQLAYESFQSLS
jgi:hypothetical protein